jgi:hypothetical protein
MEAPNGSVITLGEFAFLSTVYGRNSIDDKGFHLISTIHWDDDNGMTPGFMNVF